MTKIVKLLSIIKSKKYYTHFDLSIFNITPTGTYINFRFSPSIKILYCNIHGYNRYFLAIKVKNE